MGRKKKVVKSIEETSNNIITYKGDVTITLMHNGKTVKTIYAFNEGKQPLFEYITYCLAGVFYPSKVPSYIRLFNAEGAELTYRAIVSTTTPSYNATSTSSSVVITFNVPSTALRDGSIKILKLYSKENSGSVESPSAELTLSDAITVTSGTTFVVAWKMIVTNA